MEEMLQHIKQGDRQSFHDFYNAYHAKLYLYIYRYTQSAWLAEETVQWSFLKIWENRHTLSPEYTLSTQLFRVAKSVVIDLLRKSKVRQTLPLNFAEDKSFQTEAAAESKDELELVMDAIETMPPVQKQVFKYSRLGNLSHKEIGAELSISTKTVETHITKAIRHLKKSVYFF